MSVIDNQLNWRRVWPGPGVDVSSWSIEKRMALPDPCCIWQVGIFIRHSDHQSNYLRVGLLDDVPTSEADMNIAVELLPDFGSSSNAPERIYLFEGGPVYLELQVRMGLTTGEKKLVVEGHVYVDGAALLGMIHVVVSELPTVIPRFFNPEIVG
ncbi:hypothetical protein ES703_126090 [subsurface metagenome]